MASFERLGPMSLVCLAAMLAACGSSSSERSAQPAPEGSLCPSCLAGGETTDFSGDPVCSGIEATPVERDSAIVDEFAFDALLSRLEQPIRTSFGWRRRPGGADAAGYERETEVEFQIEVLGLSHGEWQYGGAALCSDFLLLDARIHLETVDGALRGSFERPLLLSRNAGAASVDAVGYEGGWPQLSLRDFTGTLDLGLDSERIYDGSLGIQFEVGPETLRGRLGLYMWYREDDNSRWLFTPLQAQWPSEGCDDGWAPIDPDAPLGPTDTRTARDEWQRISASFAQAFPAAATWLDQGQTEIQLQPGELDGACRDVAQPAAHYLRTQLQIRSTDARLTTTRAVQVHFRTDGDLAERITVAGEAAARDRFSEEVSVSGLNWAGANEATFELRSSRTGDGAWGGDLQIFGFDRDDRGQFENLLYLHWCSGSECETYPRVRYSPGGLNGFRLP